MLNKRSSTTMNNTWQQECQELVKACQRFQICLCETPEAFSYTPFSSILQEGPQCGLIALAMFCRYTVMEEIKQITDTAKALKYTYNGEMFSVQDMCALVKKFTNKNVELYSGYLHTDKIKKFLLNKGVMLVPYDADFNHSPCLKNGHKAHWALISGIIIKENTYIIARQGKSQHLGIWTLEDLALSNAQLNEFAPSRKQSNLQYKLPDGGISGPKGLKNKTVLIYN